MQATTTTMPLWVPFLFVGLLYAGWKQSLPRRVRPGVLAGVAAGLAALSLAGLLSQFHAAWLPLLAWVAGYAVVLAVAGRDERLVRYGDRVQMPGGWGPMGLIMGIFAVRFAMGTTAALQPALLQQPLTMALAGLTLGALSGGFGARALAVRRAAMA